MAARRGRLLLWLVLALVVAPIPFVGPSVWRWLTTSTRKVYLDSSSNPELMRTIHKVRGWETVKRGSQPYLRHGPCILYYVENGFKAEESFYENNTLVRSTIWNIDGLVVAQTKGQQPLFPPWEGHWPKRSPPWWWNVTDQTEPTAPWWNKEER